MLMRSSSSSSGGGGGSGIGIGGGARGSLLVKSTSSSQDRTDETVRTPPPQPRSSFVASSRFILGRASSGQQEEENQKDEQSSQGRAKIPLKQESNQSQSHLEQQQLQQLLRRDEHPGTMADLTNNVTLEAMNQTASILHQANYSSHTMLEDVVHHMAVKENSDYYSFMGSNAGRESGQKQQPQSFNTEVPVKEVAFTYSGAVFGRNRRKKLKTELLQSKQQKEGSGVNGGSSSQSEDLETEVKSICSEENPDEMLKQDEYRDHVDSLDNVNSKTIPTLIATSMNSFGSEPDQEAAFNPLGKLMKSKIPLAAKFGMAATAGIGNGGADPAYRIAAGPAASSTGGVGSSQSQSSGSQMPSILSSRWFTRRTEQKSKEGNLKILEEPSNEGTESSPTFNERKPFHRRILGMDPTPDTATPKRQNRDEGDEQGSSSPKKLNLYSSALKSSTTMFGASSLGESIVKRKWNLAVQLKNVNRFISKIRDQTQNQNFTKLLPHHLNLIGDKSFEQEGGSQDYFDTGAKENAQNSASSLLRKVQIFDPDDGMLIAFKMIVLLVSVVLLFFVPFVFAFEIRDEDFSLASELIFREIPLVIFICDVVCRLNTGFYMNGQFVQERKKIPRFFAFILVLDVLNIFAIAMNRLFSPGVLIAVFFIRFILVYTKTSDILEHVPLLERYPMFYNLSKLAFILLIILHSCGCGFHYVAIIQTESETNWLEYYNYDKFSVWNKYLVSIYYSTITMITVGYGDITPQTQAERLYVIAVVIVSGTVFAYTVNMIGQLFQDKEKKIAVFKQKKFDISNYMMNRSISKKTQLRVYNYLDYINTKANESPEKGQMILSEISENLRNEVYREFYGKILTNSKLFSNKFSSEFITKLTLHMQEKMFGPGEVIFLEGQQTNACLYYILKGKIEMFSKHYDVKHSFGFLSEGDSLGHRCFNASQPHDWSAMTSEVTHLVYVSQQTFLECLKEFPVDHNRYINPCNSCRKVTHLSMDCPLIHYSKNRQLCIHKHLHNTPEKERKVHVRFRSSKSNSFLMLLDMKHALKKFRLELTEMHSKVPVPLTSAGTPFDSAESDREFFARMNNKFKFTETSNSLVLDSKPSESESEDEEEYDEEDSQDEKMLLLDGNMNAGTQRGGATTNGAVSAAGSLNKIQLPQQLTKISDDSEEQSDDSILLKETKSKSNNNNQVFFVDSNCSSNVENNFKQKQRFFRGSQFKFNFEDILNSESTSSAFEFTNKQTSPPLLIGNAEESTRGISPIGIASISSNKKLIDARRNSLMNMQPIKLQNVGSATAYGGVAGVGAGEKKNFMVRQGTGGDLSSLSLVKSTSNQDGSELDMNGIDSSVATSMFMVNMNMRSEDSPMKTGSPQRRNTRAHLQHLNQISNNPKELSLFNRRLSVNVVKTSSKQGGGLGGGGGAGATSLKGVPTSKLARQQSEIIYGSPLVVNSNSMGRAIGMGTNASSSYYNQQWVLQQQQQQAMLSHANHGALMGMGGNMNSMGMVVGMAASAMAPNAKKKDEFFLHNFDELKEFVVYYPLYNYSNIIKKLNTKITLAKKRIMTLVPQNIQKRLRKRTNTVRLAQLFIPGKKKVDSAQSVIEEVE